MTEFFTKIRTPLMEAYNGIAGIITLVAAVFIGICSIGMMVAKNQRTVEEFKAWRTRALITWVIFFMLGTILRLGQGITSGMSLTSSDLGA